MSTSILDVQLDVLESQLKEFQTSLLAGSPLAVQATGETLQRLTVEFIQLADGVGRGKLKSTRHMQRIKALAAGIANLRESLLRQLAYVDRALEIIVPATREKATYAGRGAYGSRARQSGAFSVLSA